MKLSEIFSDHMVFQREKPIRVFGSGVGSGTILFDGTIKSFQARGEFVVTLPAHRAGGPYEMILTFTNETPEPGEKKNVRLIFKDVLVGDVFIAGGQSNMEFRLRDADPAERTLKDLPQVRYFEEPHSADPDMNLSYRDKKWEIFNPKNEPDFSAIAYYFACKYREDNEVPVGIVSCCRGASRVDAWMMPETEDSEEVRTIIETHHPDREAYRFNLGHWLYSNKLKNIIPFSVKGVLWYQGESNRCYEEAVHYDRLFELMVKDWRKLFMDELPFYTVELMPFEEPIEKADWAEVRASQERAAKTVPGVRMVTLFETGEASEIHPTRKKALAEALEKAVLCDSGRPVEYSGPVLREAEFLPEMIVLHFDHGEDLRIDGEALSDCCVLSGGVPCGFTASVVDGRLVLMTEKAAEEVRLGFSNVPKHNLKNGAGYLASPFRVSK